MVKKIVKGAELERQLGPRPHAPSLPSHRGVISKGELSAQDRAQILIEEAEKEARRIKVEAEKLFAQIKEEMGQAKSQGYREGKEEGNAELTEEILKVRKLKEEFFANAEQEAVKLVMAIAEKVIGKLVEEHKESVRSIVHQALEHSIGDRIVVRINPEDLKRLNKEDMQFKDLLNRTKQLHFKEDETIQKGGCVVETEVGTIDAQLETQLKAIRKAMGV